MPSAPVQLASLLLAIGVALLHTVVVAQQKDMFVGGLFPIDPNDKGKGRRERAEHFKLAAQLINNKSDGWYDELLPATRLRVRVDDSNCNSALAVRNLVAQLEWPSPNAQLSAVVGPGCSSPTLSTAYLARVKQVPQISFSATSPSLSGMPFFHRVCSSDTVKADAIIEALEHWSWESVGIMMSDTTYGKSIAQHFADTWLAKKGRRLMGTFTPPYVPGGTKLDANSISASLESLHAAGARVICIFAHQEDEKQILSVADARGSGAADVVWILLDKIDDLSSMNNIHSGVFSLEESKPENSRAAAYLKLWATRSDFFDEDGDRSTVDVYAFTSHDALLTVATAYHNALAARNTSASNSSIDGTVVEQHLSLLDGTTAKRTVFGVSGNVAFNGVTKERTEYKMTLFNLQHKRWVRVGTVTKGGERVRLTDTVLFADGTSNVPIDSVEEILGWWVVPVLVVIGVVFVLSIGFVNVYRCRSKHKNMERRLTYLAEKKNMKATLGRYLSSALVDQVLDSGENVLGGKTQKVSVLFSDIRSFTTISENMGAVQLVAMLNEYFDYMIPPIFDNHGVLDKFIGDAIMAVFGVPFVSDDDGASDSIRAAKCALEMIVRLDMFNAMRAAKGKDGLQIGLGINTGQVVSGNIGSLTRMEYTVIGDNVNLASRLEGITKTYGVPIVISEYTNRDIKDVFVTRELDTVAVKGKEDGVKIYELVAVRAAKRLTRGRNSSAHHDLVTMRRRQHDEEQKKQKMPVVDEETPGSSMCDTAGTSMLLSPRPDGGGDELGKLQQTLLLRTRVSAIMPHLQDFEAALALYRTRDFTAASEIFASIHKAAGDAPSEMYVRRCAEYLADPPPRDWDGVYRPKSK